MPDQPRPVQECQRCNSECINPDYSGCEHCRETDWDEYFTRTPLRSVSDQPRPVWLTREQVEELADIARRTPDTAVAMHIVNAWDAAPSDATEAIDGPLKQVLPSALMEPDTRRSIANHVLRALGYVTNERNDHA